MRALLLGATALFFITASCGAPGRDNSAVPGERVEIARFDIEAADYPQLDSAGKADFIERYRSVIAMTAGEGATDSTLTAYSASRGVTVFTPDIKERFGSTDSVEDVLTKLRANLAASLPSVRWPRIYAAVSTYNQSIIMADTVMLLGLNHYLGEDYPGYSYFEPYQRHVKRASHLPYDIAEALIAKTFPFPDTLQATMLSRMLHDGAITYMMLETVPQADIAEALGYTSGQAEWMNENEGRVWKRMIEQQMLFSTDPMTASRLLRPAPATAALHPEAPGRAGRYIGLRIVEAYMKQNPETAPATLLSPEFYNSPSTLVDAAYAP